MEKKKKRNKTQHCHYNECSPISNESLLSDCSQNVYFVLFFRSLIMMGLPKDIFGFILSKFHLVSRICRFVSFAKLGMFSAIISVNTLFSPTFLLPSGTLMIGMLNLSVIFLQISKSLFVFFFFFQSMFYFFILSSGVSITNI